MTVATQNIFRFADFEVRELGFCATRSGQPLAIEPKAFRVLLCLLHSAGHLVSKEELFKTVWGDTAVTDNSLTRAIALLRRVLEDDPHQPHFIETVATAGYRFICSVAVEDQVHGSSPTTSTQEGRTRDEAAAPLPSNGSVAQVNSIHKRWLIVAGAGTALFLAVWTVFSYLPRLLPPPRITYQKLTQDGHDKILAGTDGSRIYFTDGSEFSIRQLAIGGGDPGPVASAARLGLAAAWDVSRDGSHLLIAQRELGFLPWEMWVVSTVGQSQRHLGAAVHGAFSPDGQSIVYSTYRDGLWTIRADGSGVRKLADTPGGYARNLAWKPDGSVIRFTINARSWEIQADGSNLHPILSEWKPSFDRCCGRWSSDSRFFVFIASEARDGVSRPLRSQIWMIDESGGFLRKAARDPVQLTTGPIGWDSPIPSRDGKIVFAEGRARLGELVRVDPRNRQVQPFLNGISAEFISFSPDRKSVAYVTFPDGIAWKADADGSHPVQLSERPEYAINPVWSPDGSQLLFAGTPGNQIHLVSADGRNRRELMSGASDPYWSPDGRRIVVGIRTASRKSRLSIMEVSTRTTTEVPQSDDLFSPRWSPDGRYIAALSVVPPCLRVFDLKTQQWKTVPLGGDINFPSWSRDGRYIYGLEFDTSHGERWIFRVPVTGAKPERIVDLNGWKLTGWCGFSLTLDPTDAPLILRETGSSEIYALKLERD